MTILTNIGRVLLYILGVGAIALMVCAVIYTCVPSFKDKVDQALKIGNYKVEQKTEDKQPDTSAQITFSNDYINIIVG